MEKVKESTGIEQAARRNVGDGTLDARDGLGFLIHRDEKNLNDCINIVAQAQGAS
jgi:hypothetical protein